MSLHTMMTTSEQATQKSITLPLLSVHHISFLWASFASAKKELVLCTNEALRCLKWGWLSLLAERSLCEQSTLL